MASGLTCPKCGQAALSAWRKINLGPWKHTSCANCGATVGVSTTQGLVGIAVLSLAASMGGFAVLALAIRLAGPVQGGVAVVLTVFGGALIAGILALGYIHYVQLVRRDA